MEDSIAKSLSAWFVQICGFQDEIAFVHLAFNGLYVAILQFKMKAEVPYKYRNNERFSGHFQFYSIICGK